MSLTKLNIDEANAHLRQLHKRVFELENQIQMQALHVEELQNTNLHLQQQLKKTTREHAEALKEKDGLVSELTQRLEESEEQVQQLLEAAQERDAAVSKLEKKARLFYEVVEHRSSLSCILAVMDELSVQDSEEDEKEDKERTDSNRGTTGGSNPRNSPETETAAKLDSTS